MLYATPVITVYCVVLAVILGACMGSFLNCWAWRIVHGESVAKGRSHCDACGHALAFRDLVPVVSYLASHGKCRYCGKKLGVRHLAAELSTAAVYVAILLKYDISLQTLEYILFASLLLGCAFADLEGYMIPDRFILAGIILRPVFLLLGQEPNSAWINSILGGACVAGALLLVVLVYEKLRKVEAMGGGDIKLLFVTGLYLGWQLKHPLPAPRLHPGNPLWSHGQPQKGFPDPLPLGPRHHRRRHRNPPGRPTPAGGVYGAAVTS